MKLTLKLHLKSPILQGARGEAGTARGSSRAPLAPELVHRVCNEVLGPDWHVCCIRLPAHLHPPGGATHRHPLLRNTSPCGAVMRGQDRARWARQSEGAVSAEWTLPGRLAGPVSHQAPFSPRPSPHPATCSRLERACRFHRGAFPAPDPGCPARAQSVTWRKQRGSCL